MSRNTEVIQVRDLYKYYGRVRALGPVSFSIQAGEVIGLVGLNGAGKTTALRILACDLMPSGGEVRVDGIDVVDDPRAVRARIGYLPDRPPLYGDMSVHEYLVFAARLRGVDGAKADRAARETEEATQITNVAGDMIASLSHGYRQRVGIAQAIVHRPRLVILDEPISGLDPLQIVEMRQLLLSLKGSHTILLSSHILSEISQTCDRLLVIRGGCIVDAGTEAELSERLRAGTRLELTVRASAERIERALDGFDGVRTLEQGPAAEPEPEVTTWLIGCERDIRSALVAHLVASEIPVLGLARSERELETIFSRLVAGPRAAGEEDEPEDENQEQEEEASS
jgi:ABC-2 type transport system ATP-binding protein